MSKKNDFVNQWGAFGKTMLFYRWLSILSVILAMAAVMALVIFHDENPLVVVKECGDKHFYFSGRQKIMIKNQDVEKFAKRFIQDFYGKKDVECIMVKGLQKLVTASQKLNQYVGRIEIILEEKFTLASFDLIVSIENVPLVVKKQVKLQIIQGKKTTCNPVGLYINGISEKGGQ